ncbi:MULTISPECIES: hypothetical protein [Streptomyces]|uniref:hypothetical protein n=1 Tax=Streptomyces TaxID=1883 RepID=UPI0003829EA4|nr:MULTISPECIES: hypothetical protein [unclassified Streptomyces]WSX92358.1 hypothetical protein OH827_18310 [Streptomyces sp. NBC_00891]WSY06835.1 hypothetical protein OG464_18310 [Streptomyces sp. NBC_00890]WSZ08461.1 hypothetical protein OG704_18310 [Streptomyces sp. NBC_00869]WSZ24040.1 hypothetical protein OG498_15255 [Streptomyces sp. NBC_00870]MYS38905.1 hypothetical protein [Streptomyces sp. SID4920]
MSFRISYAPPADDTLAKMGDGDTFRDRMAGTLGVEPYGHGSTAVKGEHDRREATVAGAIVLYYVSGSVLTVTVVRLVPLP